MEYGKSCDSTKFYADDFEMAFNGARFEELMVMDRVQLIERYQKLEANAAILQKELLYLNPDEVLSELRRQVSLLNAENQALKQTNQAILTMKPKEGSKLSSRRPHRDSDSSLTEDTSDDEDDSSTSSSSDSEADQERPGKQEVIEESKSTFRPITSSASPSKTISNHQLQVPTSSPSSSSVLCN